MKKAALFLTLSLLLIAAPAFSQPSLEGTWCVSMSEAYSAEGPAPGLPLNYGDFSDAEYEIVIDDQDDSFPYGILFYGHVDVYGDGSEFTYFSGVLDGRRISMTHWDSVTRGVLRYTYRRNRPMEIHFINNAFDANPDKRVGKTSIGVAVKGTCD